MDSIVREEIIEWITKAGNEELLETLKLIKESSSDGGDWYDELSKEEKNSIQRGLKDLENGRSITSDKFWDKHG